MLQVLYTYTGNIIVPNNKTVVSRKLCIVYTKTRRRRRRFLPMVVVKIIYILSTPLMISLDEREHSSLAATSRLVLYVEYLTYNT